MLVSLAVAGAVFAAVPFIIRALYAEKIFNSAADVPDAYCCLVPGALVYRSGNPSAILRDRLKSALKLYRSGKGILAQHVSLFSIPFYTYSGHIH